MALTLEDWRALRERSDMRQLATNARTESKSVTVLRDGVLKSIEVLYCPQLPIELARIAGTTVETYSLARNMASEGYAGDDYTLAMMVIGHVGRNVARAKYPSATYPITTLLTYSSYAAVRWRYGEQSGRWAATTRDPTRWHVMLADAIRNGEVADITRGAVKYLDPWPPGAVQRGKALPPFDQLMTVWHGPKVKVAWRGPLPGIQTSALAVFHDEPDAVKRREALVSLISEWRRMVFPRGRESESEGHSRSVKARSITSAENRGHQHVAGMGGETVGADEIKLDVPRMTQELRDTDKLFETIPAKWPQGLTRYPTVDTAKLLDALVGFKIALVNATLEARKDVRQIIINDEQWNRVVNQLDRAVDRIMPAFKTLIASRRKGEQVTELPADFRDNVIKLLIEIRSAIPAIEALKENTPGLFFSILVGIFVVTGMAMASFFRDALELVINGAVIILNAAVDAANKIRKALLPNWVLWLGGLALGGAALYKAKQDEREDERRRK